MKKILLAAIILATLSLQANAGTYSDTASEQEVCDGQGKMARAAYGVKIAGVSLNELKAHILNKPEPTPKWKMDVTLLGYDAPSAEAAYMRGWAKCKDGN